MLLSEIQRAIFSYLSANDNDLVPIAYPRETFRDKPDNGPFATMQIVPNDTVDSWCGTVKSGNILFNISFPKNSKLINPTIEAEKFLNVFNEGLFFEGVSIPNEGDIRNAIDDQEVDTRYLIPVVIGFEAR